ncbi:MAG: alpha/beta fold hydrolase, partial [Gammaproteobacteria bacterium]|nr:alpha/beta fold hydrolase [Gammaproteobacteria bacterium]
QPFILPESFVSLYGLTNKESEVTAYLARGYSIKEIAEQKYVSEHTVRTHVKAVMSKTGLRRQSDLLRFVLMGPDENNMAIDGPGRQILKQNAETETSSRSIMLPDGRRLTFQEYGDPNGTPMIFFHSVRGSQLEVENLASQAAYENGIRLIAPNRPGYGLSDPKHLDTVLDYINDVTALTDSLGLKTFDVGGYVLGGLFAKAVTWAMPERVNRLLLISCGVTAKTDEDYKNMIPLYKMSNKLARELPKVIRMLSPILVRGMLRNPAKFLEQFATQLEPKEAALFESSSFSDRIIKALQDAAYQGSRHIGREVVLLNQPWGFDPAEIRVPVTLWYGDRDRHMPIILGEKLASTIPNCKLKVVEGAGHFMAYRHMNKIFADMVK